MTMIYAWKTEHPLGFFFLKNLRERAKKKASTEVTCEKMMLSSQPDSICKVFGKNCFGESWSDCRKRSQFERDRGRNKREKEAKDERWMIRTEKLAWSLSWQKNEWVNTRGDREALSKFHFASTAQKQYVDFLHLKEKLNYRSSKWPICLKFRNTEITHCILFLPTKQNNEPFSTAERSKRVENFLFRTTRVHAGAMTVAMRQRTRTAQVCDALTGSRQHCAQQISKYITVLPRPHCPIVGRLFPMWIELRSVRGLSASNSSEGPSFLGLLSISILPIEQCALVLWGSC